MVTVRGGQLGVVVVWLLGGALAAAACSGKSASRAGGTPESGAGGDAGRATGGDAGRATGGSGGTTGGTSGRGAGGSGASGGAAGSSAGAGTGGSAGGGGSGAAGSAGRATAGAGSGGTSGEAGAPGGGEAGGGPLAALDDTVSAFCEAAATCCPAQGQPAMLDGCGAMFATYRGIAASLTSGAVTLDDAALARCRAAYADGPDQCNLNAVVAACDGVYVGHQAVGEPCQTAFDCDRSTDSMACMIADSSSDPPMGVCQKVVHAGLDDDCFSTCRAGDDCSSNAFGFDAPPALCFEEDGLFCEYVGPGSVCHAIVPLGEACSSFDACGSAAYCDTTCKPLSDLGELCGYGCRPQYQCGEDGRCQDPTWATESACMGTVPVP